MIWSHELPLIQTRRHARRRRGVFGHPTGQGDDQGTHGLGLWIRIVGQTAGGRRVSNICAEASAPAAVPSAREVITTHVGRQGNIYISVGAEQVWGHS